MEHDEQTSRVNLKPTSTSTRDELHRELLFNQRIGKDVLHQKPELKRVLEERKHKKPTTANPASEFQRVHQRIASNRNPAQQPEESNNN